MALLSYIAATVHEATSADEKKMYVGVLVAMVGVATRSASTMAPEDQRICVTLEGADPVFLTVQPGGLLHGLKELTSPPCCSKLLSQALWRDWNTMSAMPMEARDTFLLTEVSQWVCTVASSRRKRGLHTSGELTRLLDACKGPLLQWIGKMVDRWV